MDRPNVIVCLTDQLRPFEIGCYGGSVQTPEIDRLASNGVRLEVACSNSPVCTPARSALLSGQYARTCVGTQRNCPEPVPERERMLAPTLAEVFRESGYRTGLIGKWHIYPQPETLGFETVYYPNHQHRYTGQVYFRNNRRVELVDGFTVDAELAEVRSWLGDRKADPLFLYYNISQPHMPLWDQPERFRDMYSPADVPMRENVWIDGALPHDENWFKIYLHDYLYYKHHLPYTEVLPEGFDLKWLTALYYGSIAWADYQVGELMRTLEANGLAENTIVVFTSDHGDMLGSHHRFNKNSLHEESLRIPMIVHWPARLKPRVVGSQVSSLVDVMPTVLNLAGLGTPSTAQGTDIAPVLRGEAETVGENLAFCEIDGYRIGVRTPTHLYGAAMRSDDPGPQLFDTVADPFEYHNLAGSQGISALEKGLHERLERWDRETGRLVQGGSI